MGLYWRSGAANPLLVFKRPRAKRFSPQFVHYGMSLAKMFPTLRRSLPLLLPVLVLTAWYARPVARQARLDGRLVAALHAHDEAAALDALAQGADPNARDYYRTPPTLWVRLKHPDAAREDDLERAQDWEPVLMSAIIFGWDGERADRSDRLVPALLKRGADVNGRDFSGACALSSATAQGRLDWVTAMLDRGADAGCKAEALQSTPLLGSTAIARLLIAHGADVNTRDRYGTPLTNACLFRNASLIRLLLDSGADPNLRDYSGRTALGVALGGRLPDPQILLLLRRRGAHL